MDELHLSAQIPPCQQIKEKNDSIENLETEKIENKQLSVEQTIKLRYVTKVF